MGLGTSDMARAYKGPSYSTAVSHGGAYNSVQSSYIKSPVKQQPYLAQTKTMWSERPATAKSQSSTNNFQGGYRRETGILSSQLQVDKQSKGGDRNNLSSNHQQMKDQSKNRRNQTTLHVGSKCR